MTYLTLLKHLRNYHFFVYTGDKEADLDLITDELKEQYQLGIIDKNFLHEATLVIAKERASLKKR